MIIDGKLYYVSDDGSYHKLCKIKELEETIMVDDESMFLHKEDPATIRSLRKSGYFEASMDFDHIDSKVFEIFASIDNLIKKHQEYIELSWICELAKRYIVANSLKNLDTIERHGKWLDGYGFAGNYYDCFVCDQCETENMTKTNYCPNCGARMDGEQNVEIH